MIKLTNVTLLDKKNDCEPINFSNESNITYIPYENKDIYNLLSIRQQYIKDGEMMIDDFSLFPLKDQKKYAFVLNINSQVISLNAVFVLELSFKDKTRGLLKKDLQALRDLPLTNDDDKKEKINQIFAVLEKFNVKYLLINTNDQVNNDCLALIKDTMVKHEALTYFILEKKPIVVAKPVTEDINLDLESEVKKDINHQEKAVQDKKDLNEELKKEVDKDFETSKDTLIGNDEAKIHHNFSAFEKEFETFDIDIAYKKAEEKKEKELSLAKKPSKFLSRKPIKSLVFVKEIFKHLYLYYLFVGLFSIFLSICSFSSVYLINHNNGLIAGILIFLGIIFIFMHFYIIGSTYAGLKKHLNSNGEKIAFAGIFVLFTILGLGIGLGFIFILSANEVFVKTGEYVLTDWLLGIIVSLIAISAPCICSPLSMLYVKLHVLFNKLFLKNKDEEE